MMQNITPIILPHGRVVNVSAYHPGLLSQLTNKELCDHFERPDLIENDIVSLMEEFVQGVKDRVHLKRG